MAKKVILFTNSLNMGGAEHMMVNLANHMVQAGFNTCLVVCKDSQGALANKVQQSIQIIDLRVKWAFAALPGFVRQLRKFNPDAILSALPNANLIAILAVRLSGIKTRLVISERNHLSKAIKSSSQLSTCLRPWLERVFYPWADHIVAVSEGVANDMAETAGIPLKRIQVIYNPSVHPEILKKAQEPVDHTWFNEGSPPVFLSVGRLHPPKDYPNLLRAFQLLRTNHLARLMILGEGYLRAKLEALAIELGIMNDLAMPGFKDNPYSYMAKSSVFVLSSAWEGFPNVLVEAMACGTPVVSTNCPSGPAEILADGRYGHLVPVNNSIALADAMAATLVSPISKSVLQARAQEFTVQNAFIKYSKILGL